MSYESYRARRYLPELDGLRGLSVLLVVTHHMHDMERYWWWLGGELGVTIFFVISGYLITMLSLREEKQHGAISLKAFFVRRSCRIFPLYYLTLALYCVLIFGLGLQAEKRQLMLDAMPYYLLYMQELPAFFGKILLGQGDAPVPFSHSWSLGIEEKFYLVWPFLAFVVWRGATVRRQLGALALVVLLGGLPLVGAHELAREAGPAAAMTVGALVPYSKILLGCLLAVLIEEKSWFDRLRFLGRPGWLLAATALFSVLHFSLAQLKGDPDVFHWVEAAYVVMIGVFLVCVLLGDGWLQRVLCWRPLVFVGKMSYGIYLLHVLALNVADRLVAKLAPGLDGNLGLSIVNFVLAASLSILAAYLAHVFVERPAIERGRAWSKRIMERRAGAATPSERVAS